MDLKAVGQRIKSAREAKNLTQEELAALVNLSPTHVSVIERGLKVTKLDTFVAIANALDVSADTLLIDVVAHSITGVTNEMTDKIEKLPIKEQKKIIKIIHTLLEEQYDKLGRASTRIILFIRQNFPQTGDMRRALI